MIKQMAWNTFKNTGSIDSYLELVQVEILEKNMENEVNVPYKSGIKHSLGEPIGIDTKKPLE